MNEPKLVAKNELTPFRINEEEICFDPALFRYIELESRFEPEFSKTATAIEAAFGDELEDIIDYVENIDGFLKKTFTPLSEFAAKQLSLEGCYDYDADLFYRKCVEPKFERLLQIKDALQKELDRIDAEQEERNEMRVERREQATQEARAREYVWRDRDGRRHVENSASGEQTFQYMKNILGRAVDAINNASEREELYDASKDEIKKELMWICYDMVGSVAYALGESTGIDIRDPRTPEDYEKASTIFKNLLSGHVRPEQIDDAAMQIFRLNPQEKGFLPWCVERYGDPNGEFDRAAELFHVDVATTKRKKMEAAVKVDTEADAQASKKELEELEARLSFSAPDLMKKVDDALVKFDLEYRTVDGVEYKTRDEADLARKELEEVKKVSACIPLDNPERCQAFVEAIAALGLKTAVADKVVQAAKKRFSQQKDKVEQIIRKYNMSADDATLLLTRHSALARSELASLRMYDPVNPPSADVTKAFDVQDGDIALGFLDFYNGIKKGGMLISQKGIYSKYIPFYRTKGGFTVSAIGATVLFYIGSFLVSVIIEGGLGDFLWTCMKYAWIVLIAVLIFRKLIFRKYDWDTKNRPVFTKLSDVSLSLSNTGKELFVSGETSIPYKRTKKFFEKLQATVKEQQELAQ